jgi:Spy/CpxP family protein refolding chaperone
MLAQKQKVLLKTKYVEVGRMKKYIIIAFQLTIIAIGWFILTWMLFDAMPSLAQDSSSSDMAVDSDAGQPPHQGGIFRLIMQRLNLTDDQKNQILSILADERSSLKPLIQQLKAGKEQLRSLTADGTFNEDQVRAFATQQAGTIADLIVVKQRVKSKVFGVLTPDQRAEARKMLDLLIKSHHRGRLEQAG